MSRPYRMSLSLVDDARATPRQQASLAAVKKRFGLVPNTIRAMANEPSLIDTYLLGMSRLAEESGFTPAELEVIFLTISYENGCDYCVAAHSVSADVLAKLNPEVTDALREGREIADPKLRALSNLVRAVLLERGRPSTEAVQAFLDAGYAERQILAVVLAVSLKTLTNYTNHLFETPLDPMFKIREWTAFKVGVKVANFFRRTQGSGQAT